MIEDIKKIAEDIANQHHVQLTYAFSSHNDVHSFLFFTEENKTPAWCGISCVELDSTTQEELRALAKKRFSWGAQRANG